MTLHQNEFVSQYLHEKNGVMRKEMLLTFQNEAKSRVIPLYLEALKDPIVENKAIAINFLCNEGVEEALEPLIDLTQYRLEIYDDLISNIVKLVKNVNLNQVLAYINNENFNIKKSIALILGQLKDENSTESLIRLLQDKNALVRKNAITALETVAGRTHLEVITRMISDKNVEVQIEAVKALGQIGSNEAVKPLLPLLRSDNSELRDVG